MQTVKMVISGAVNAGKTEFIKAISEIEVVSTERRATDDTKLIKKETTVAMDFGRITIDQDLILYLFGTPGQTRFWFMWDELVRGAIGAVVLVDTRRLADCFAAIDFFEHRQLPYLIAINCFDGIRFHTVEDVREALAISPETPVIMCDARSRESTKQVLITLVEYVLSLRRNRANTPDATPVR